MKGWFVDNHTGRPLRLDPWRKRERWERRFYWHDGYALHLVILVNHFLLFPVST